MPRKFDQDAKDRVVRLVEDRILAENISMQAACKIVAPKLGFRGTQRGNGRRPLVAKDVLWNQCPRTLLQKTHGCVEKIKSCGTPTSC